MDVKMKTKNCQTYCWTLPREITLEEIPSLAEKFNSILPGSTVTLDLTKTEDIHSSFIGFILNARNTIFRENGELNLQLSGSAEKIISMLNISDYIKTGSKTGFTRKTA